jgi:hypothetical protein
MTGSGKILLQEKDVKQISLRINIKMMNKFVMQTNPKALNYWVSLL